MKLDTRFETFKGIGKVFLTFKIRKFALIGLVVLGFIPGNLIFELPVALRTVWVSAFTVLAMASAFSISQLFATPMIEMAGSVIWGRKFRPEQYVSEEAERLAKKMGLTGVGVFKTANPWIRGPCCNLLTKKVLLPTKFVETTPKKEILGAVSHEYGHFKTSKRYFGELMAGLAVVFLLSTLLYSLPTIILFTVIALEILAMIYVSWRNEYRADMIGAMNGEICGLIALLEKFKGETNIDEGSETHPPLKDRIQRLYDRLDLEDAASP